MYDRKKKPVFLKKPIFKYHTPTQFITFQALLPIFQKILFFMMKIADKQGAELDKCYIYLKSLILRYISIKFYINSVCQRNFVEGAGERSQPPPPSVLRSPN